MDERELRARAAVQAWLAEQSALVCRDADRLQDPEYLDFEITTYLFGKQRPVVTLEFEDCGLLHYNADLARVVVHLSHIANDFPAIYTALEEHGFVEEADGFISELGREAWFDVGLDNAEAVLVLALNTLVGKA